MSNTPGPEQGNQLKEYVTALDAFDRYANAVKSLAQSRKSVRGDSGTIINMWEEYVRLREVLSSAEDSMVEVLRRDFLGKALKLVEVRIITAPDSTQNERLLGSKNLSAHILDIDLLSKGPVKMPYAYTKLRSPEGFWLTRRIIEKLTRSLSLPRESTANPYGLTDLQLDALQQSLISSVSDIARLEGVPTAHIGRVLQNAKDRMRVASLEEAKEILTKLISLGSVTTSVSAAEAEENPLALTRGELFILSQLARGVPQPLVAKAIGITKSGVAYRRDTALNKIGVIDGEEMDIEPNQAMSYLGKPTENADTPEQAILGRKRSFIIDAYSKGQANQLTEEEIEKFYSLLPLATQIHRDSLVRPNRDNLEKILDRVYAWVYLHEPAVIDKIDGVSRGSLNNSRRAFAKALGRSIGLRELLSLPEVA